MISGFGRAALAATLLVAQPGFAQDSGLSLAEEAAIDDAAVLLGDDPADDGAPGGPPALPPRPEPRPAIWLLQDADTKIYLFGTFHILPPGFRWRSPAVERVIGDADELVLEVIDRDAMDDPGAVLAQMALGKLAPLAWRVSPDRRQALAEMLAETGLPAEMFDGMKTWAATMTIAVLQIAGQYSGEDGAPAQISDLPGVEDVLEREFAGLARPISGVETMAQQMGFFASMSFAEERRMLEEMIDAYRGGAATADVSEIEWARGNVDALAIGRDEMPAGLYAALITRRNEAWTDWLITRLDRPGTILFAVGAGHLAGPDSVQAMLAARGFTAARID